MACALVALNSNQDCGLIEGGILYSYAAKKTDITAFTVSGANLVTAITMASVGLWKKLQYDTDNTSLFEQPGTRNGNRITFAQKAFMKFKGLTAAYREMANNAKDCCDVVIIHRLANGEAIIQGVELSATATGGFTRTKVLETRVIPTMTTDTGQNEPRLELSVEGTSNHLAPHTNLTDAAIEAL